MAYAVLPALCEEFVYRGILCREYERGGVLRAVIVSALFFALLHFNLGYFPLECRAVFCFAHKLRRSLYSRGIVARTYDCCDLRFSLYGYQHAGNL